MSLRVKIIDDDPQVVVTLQEAKEWLAVDYPDFDDLIQSLIDSSIQRSQKGSGCAYWPVTVEVKGNKACEFIYPIQPIIQEAEGTDFENYNYEAGFETLPEDLKRAVLQRVATGFAERQNGFEKAINKATETSLMIEVAYREDLYI